MPKKPRKKRSKLLKRSAYLERGARFVDLISEGKSIKEIAKKENLHAGTVQDGITAYLRYEREVNGRRPAVGKRKNPTGANRIIAKSIKKAKERDALKKQLSNDLIITDSFKPKEAFSNNEMDYGTIDFNNKYNYEDVVKEVTKDYQLKNRQMRTKKLLTLILVLVIPALGMSQMSFLGLHEKEIPNEMFKAYNEQCMFKYSNRDTFHYTLNSDTLMTIACYDSTIQSVYMVMRGEDAKQAIEFYKHIYISTKYDFVYTKYRESYFYIEWYEQQWGTVFKFYRGHPINEVLTNIEKDE